MRVKFWGVRGSVPTLISSSEIEGKIRYALREAKGINLSDPRQVEAYLATLPRLRRGTAGGNTPCVEVEAAGKLIILDAGTGLRTLGLELMKGKFGEGKGVAHIFISHTHWDHIQGFPFFSPAYVPGNQIFIYGPHSDIRGRFEVQQRPTHFPVPLDHMPAKIEFVQLREEEKVELNGVKITNIKLFHPGDSYGYRIEEGDVVLCYATDSEYKDLSDQVMAKHWDFFRDADVLIFDAQYSLKEYYVEKEDWGHSASPIGVEIALRAGVKRLLLFHHEHTKDDQVLEEILQEAVDYLHWLSPEVNCEVLIAYEGLELVL